MATLEHLAQILALTRISNREVTQPQRVIALLDSGVEGALELVDPNVLTPQIEVFGRARADIGSWLADGIQIVSIEDDLYPHQLAQVREAPALIYCQGELVAEDRAVAVVGSRDASPRALVNARRISHELVAQGYTVASGLAAGIDTAAHKAALEVGGRTVAVMGTGIYKTYPVTNIKLRQNIIEHGGLVLTQFEPNQGPTKFTFPMRNAVMSGYSLATIVVEASKHSGTRIQAKKALLHGKNVILLTPVVEQTQWAKDMLANPGVYQAHDMAQLRDVLSQIEENHKILAAV